jgi:hypothetical protein
MFDTNISIACRSTAGVSVAMWVRAILPSLLGKALPTTKTKSIWHKDCRITKLNDAAGHKALLYIEEKLKQGMPVPNKLDYGVSPAKSAGKQQSSVAVSVNCAAPAASLVRYLLLPFFLSSIPAVRHLHGQCTGGICN